MSFSLQQALQYLCDQEGSDLHVKAGSPPMVRVSGELTPLPMADPLTPDDTAQAVREMLRDPTRLQELETEGEADFAYAVPGLARFRVNAFRQRGSISIVCRRIPYGVTTIAELGLPDAVRDMAGEPRGIVLVTGTTGSGKSTTLAAMVDQVNTTAARHIVTIEDPIEFLHADKRSVINQREVGSDTGSFGRALRRVLRQDPDIILIGEMRDEETVRTALSAAETATWSSRRCTPRTLPRRSTASSTSSRLTITARFARCSRRRCAGSSRSGLCRRSTVAGLRRSRSCAPPDAFVTRS